MRNPVILALTLMVATMTQTTTHAADSTVRIASFNVSMEAGNYVAAGATPTGEELFLQLAEGRHPQIRNIAEIIQRTRPDILLLNEFDFSPDPKRGVLPFLRYYLQRSQRGAEPIDYPFHYSAPVNTGIDSGLDLDRDGVASGRGQDAFGYGLFPGHYGMLLLSRYPLDASGVRSFQHFLWRDMPGNLLQGTKDAQGDSWYTPAARERLRLSSKSHWDIPVIIDGQRVHVLASHPTPPVFDGPEDRNGRRNHDEIRFWSDYLSGGEQAAYIYDDSGLRGGLRGDVFVVMGDLNASPLEGDGLKPAITGLLRHPRINSGPLPTSSGGREHSPDNPHAASHTASFRLRVDYVLPSTSNWQVEAAGVFWPTRDDPLRRLVRDRRASSDHRMVWLDLVLSARRDARAP